MAAAAAAAAAAVGLKQSVGVRVHSFTTTFSLTMK
jgi:hypothetical protein